MFHCVINVVVLCVMLQSFHSLMMNKDNWSELIRSMSLGKPFVSAAVANMSRSERYILQGG